MIGCCEYRAFDSPSEALRQICQPSDPGQQQGLIKVAAGRAL
jgi:hypothetical protein